MLLPVAVGGEVGAWVVLGRVGGFDRLPSSLRSNPGAGGGRPHIVRSFLYGRNLTGPPARRRCSRGRVTASHLLDPTVREESAGGGRGVGVDVAPSGSTYTPHSMWVGSVVAVAPGSSRALVSFRDSPPAVPEVAVRTSHAWRTR